MKSIDSRKLPNKMKVLPSRTFLVSNFALTLIGIGIPIILNRALFTTMIGKTACIALVVAFIPAMAYVVMEFIARRNASDDQETAGTLKRRFIIRTAIVIANLDLIFIVINAWSLLKPLSEPTWHSRLWVHGIMLLIAQLLVVAIVMILIAQWMKLRNLEIRDGCLNQPNLPINLRE